MINEEPQLDLLQSPLGDVPQPSQRIQRFANEFKDLFADAFVEKSHNERLVQDASIGASTALSSRRKPIDGALAQILHADKAQLEMSRADDLNSWLIDRVRLIGNPKIDRKEVDEALAIIGINRPHLEYNLDDDEEKKLARTNIKEVELEGTRRYDDDLRLPWHVWAPAQNRPAMTAAQIARIDSKDAPISLNPRGARFDPRMGPLEQVQQPQGQPENKDSDVDLPQAPAATPAVVITPQQTFIGPQNVDSKRPRTNPASGSGVIQGQGPDPMRTDGQYYGGIADWFAPSEKQKKQAAEAKILKVLQKTSHPALVFARDYYLTYDRSFDPVRIQTLPMQRTLLRTRATLEMFRNSNRGSDYELIKVLLDRDLLEADLALDPAREDKLSELDVLLKERWSRIKLVHV